MLTFRRKPNSGKMHMMSRSGGSKARKASLRTLYPGDMMTVETVEQLPGYPHSMDGWELIDSNTKPQDPEAKTVQRDMMGTGAKRGSIAVLRASRVRGENWCVKVDVPGDSCRSEDGVVLPKGTKLNKGFLTEERARQWAELGYDPEPGE